MEVQSIGYRMARTLPLAFMAWSLLALPGCAQKERLTTPAPASQRDAGPEIQEQALHLLRRMSDTLAAAGSFTYSSHSAVEVPGRKGRLLTFFSRAEVAVERPNKLRVDITGDVPNFQVVYDGTQLSVYDPVKNLYAVSEAPPSIDGAIRLLLETSKGAFPAANVVFGNPYAAMTEGLHSAFVVGTSRIDGLRCQHLAFMKPGVDWELWIDTGPHPLPRRLAVTYHGVAHSPRLLAEFSDWNLHPSLGAEWFAVREPPGARRIDFTAQIRQDFAQSEGKD
ncbi:conserved protein of unknown function [Candidatus Methylocalor cossyra]|uniref:DUF2092 domain-containing protein n=2 Tax=Candidatus Methylocalor cossyra TaxID=3108543 RepID=A0ABM9NM18_9GAMM